MTEQVFNYFNIDDIIFVDDYKNLIKLHEFENIKFRSEISHFKNFQTPLGVNEDNKIISITNKQLSFLIQEFFHYIGGEYGEDLKTTYQNIINSDIKNMEVIDESVFLFFDYESVNGTVHSYDLIFYLLYHYLSFNLNCKLLVVESDNKYYNLLLELIKKYFNVEYLFIKNNKTYFCKNLKCIRSYINIFFNEVKEFVNNKLIIPIIKKYEKIPKKYYETVIKIKYTDKSNLNSHYSYDKTENFANFMTINNILDLNNIEDEELKIYYLNKANNIIISWGSTYYININYYLINTKDKFISLLYHPNIMSEAEFIINKGDYYLQYMPEYFTNNCVDQVYNKWTFYGEIFHNIDDLEMFITNTKLTFGKNNMDKKTIIKQLLEQNEKLLEQNEKLLEQNEKLLEQNKKILYRMPKK
jgi:hypothetical protein